MSGWEIFWTIVVLVILAGIIGGLIMNLADLKRYMKIRRM